MTRREFIETGVLTASSFLSGCSGFEASVGKNETSGFIWADLVHLGMNFWGDMPRHDWEGWQNVENETIRQAVKDEYCSADHVRFDERLWRDVAPNFRAAGANMIVLDLGEAVEYPSHPEIAVSGAWSVDKLRSEIAHLRSMGFEVIPKLNFSATHDTWLGEYHKMVSTRKYYEVVSDLIRDVSDIFDGPRFLHLGMDEEIVEYQKWTSYLVKRQGDLWWHDFNYCVKETERRGMRPWIWSDYERRHPEEFYRRMPKSVVQSPWDYRGPLDPSKNPLTKIYLDLDRAGFDVIVCASNCYRTKDNFVDTTEFCRRNLSRRHYIGAIMAPWLEMNGVFRARHLEAASQIAEARRRAEQG